MPRYFKRHVCQSISFLSFLFLYKDNHRSTIRKIRRFCGCYRWHLFWRKWMPKNTRRLVLPITITKFLSWVKLKFDIYCLKITTYLSVKNLFLCELGYKFYKNKLCHYLGCADTEKDCSQMKDQCAFSWRSMIPKCCRTCSGNSICHSFNIRF